MMKRIVKSAFAAAVALAVNGVPAEAADKKIACEGSTTVLPIAEAFAEHFMELHPDVNVTVAAGGSGNGAKAILNGTADVGNMSRFMKEKEFQECAKMGRLPTAHVVAFDGIALVVNKANSVKALTLKQVRDIYAGDIKNWRELGGPDKEIVIISRDHNSGTFETFKNIVMAGEKEIDTSAQSMGSNGAIRTAVQGTPGAVGYVGLGFMEGVKALEINGVLPSLETVKTGVYPIARPLFMFTDGYPRMGTPLFQFITLYLTEDGQDIVEELEFVPVTNY
jgi:phosphate transport system substrate-binding protein